MAENGSKYPTWQWIVGLSILLIGFLASQGLSSFNYRITEQEKTGQQQMKAIQDVCDRTTRLEANYGHIIDGISRIENRLNKREGK